MTASLKFPFLSEKAASQRSDYENDSKNIIEKVRTYHENREDYEAICRRNPNQRLAFDFSKEGQQVAHKKAANRGASTATVSEKRNNNEQINLF